MISSRGQPVGVVLEWRPAERPRPAEHRGAHALLRPIDPVRDAPPLYAATHEPGGDPRVWTYLFDGPFPDLDAYSHDLQAKAASQDPLFFAVCSAQNQTALGVISLMSVVPQHGSIEIGNVMFAPVLQRTAAATEAVFLLAAHAFELGYRRLEWKCNALNEPSREAALRFGFEFEGIFRQHMVIKGRNRDTAWFAITDERWRLLLPMFQAWLAPENFAADGTQLRSLRNMISAVHAE